MDRFGTKTRGEREDEEVERLVRPSPKVKPPRHDRRRETVEVDQDPDLETTDKDLSKNFKDIGGSMASRVLRRWAADPEAPEPKKVKVRNKITGWVGPINEETFKTDPGDYELADDSAEETFKRKPKPQAGPQSKQPTPEEAARVEKDKAAQKALQDLAKKDPAIAKLLERVKKPENHLSISKALRENSSAKPFMQGHDLPEGIETVNDLARVLELKTEPPPAPTPKKKPTTGQKPAAPAGAFSGPPQSAAPAPAQPKPKAEPKPDPKQPEPEPEPEAEQEQEPQPAAESKPEPEPQPAPARKPEPAPKPEAAPKKAPEPATPATPAAPPVQPAPAQPTTPAPADEALEAEITKAWVDAGFYPGTSHPVGKVLDVLGAGNPLKSEDLDAAIQSVRDAIKDPGTPKDTIKGLKSLVRSLKSYDGPVAGKEPGGKQPKQPKKHQEVPEGYTAAQPDRKVSTSERQAADNLLVETFPQDVAVKLLFADPPYHPDEIRGLVSDYNLAKSIPVPDDVSSLVKKASSFYTIDPKKVRPPKTVKAEDGSEVDFNSLTDPAEQAKAYRKHQVRAVAMSLAVRAALSSSFEKKGASGELSMAMSNFMLSTSQETPSSRMKRATDRAEQLFLTGLKEKSDEPPMSDKAVQRLLQASDDLAVQKLIVGYCQARDYQEARKQFLSPKSSHQISERQPPQVIASSLRKAAELLRTKAERYPQGTMSLDTSKTFRDRVMKHLGTLDSEKYNAVQKLLDVDDNRQYEQDVKKFEDAVTVYNEQKKQAAADYDSDYKAYSEKLKESGNQNLDPPLGVEDRLITKKIVKPSEPIKPPRYDLLTKKPDELVQDASGFWDDFTSRHASDRRVAARVAKRHAFSIYSATCSMDRRAVYWGVTPYPKGHEGFESYKGWEQPQARDLGDSDYSRVLKAARGWLSTPVLSTKIEGIVRDTQLRAALDLALRAENCDHAVHPTIYNKLLARLAGVSEDETLLTVRSKTARNPMPKNKVEFETAKADQFLARLDRMASVVQSNHKQWGMGFTAAKNLVNAIDKLADDLEQATYGTDSLLNRQTSEIGHEKLAQVIQRDSDEKYMDAFKNPMQPIQTEADERYMSAYKDDQSSAVHSGKSTTGRPLAK